MWLLALRFLPFLSKLTPVLGLVKNNLKLIGVVIIVLALAGNWLYIQMLQTDLKREMADKRLFSTWLSECQDINVKNQNTVSNLRLANGSLARSVIVSEKVRLAAEEDATERDLRAQMELDATLETLQELQNESLSCDALMQVDLGAVCPLTDQRLRKLSTGPADN